MVSTEYLAVIFGMGMVTFLPRWLPLVYLTKRSLPAWLVEWLDFIPAAILSAILLPALVTDSATRSLDFGRPEFPKVRIMSASSVGSSLLSLGERVIKSPFKLIEAVTPGKSEAKE